MGAPQRHFTGFEKTRGAESQSVVHVQHAETTGYVTPGNCTAQKYERMEKEYVVFLRIAALVLLAASLWLFLFCIPRIHTRISIAMPVLQIFARANQVPPAQTRGGFIGKDVHCHCM